MRSSFVGLSWVLLFAVLLKDSVCSLQRCGALVAGTGCPRRRDRALRRGQFISHPSHQLLQPVKEGVAAGVLLPRCSEGTSQRRRWSQLAESHKDSELQPGGGGGERFAKWLGNGFPFFQQPPEMNNNPCYVFCDYPAKTKA